MHVPAAVVVQLQVCLVDQPGIVVLQRRRDALPPVRQKDRMGNRIDFRCLLHHLVDERLDFLRSGTVDLNNFTFFTFSR